MRETRLYGSEGGGAARSPYPYQFIHSSPSQGDKDSQPFGYWFVFWQT